ncbi:MAG TPA: glutamine synthetase [Clostridiales bacterium]|nr:glutamine synthetase [Clostridiales bacterium]HQP70554.1 glutamine synthetase [Clostridiales bacterium]
MLDSLCYYVKDENKNREGLKLLTEEHSNIRFVSLFGVDFLGNDVDERIPIGYFLDNIEDIFSGGVQTDGSSVNLPGIATINDAKIDFIVDTKAKWFIDYNLEGNIFGTEPTGTIRIPVFFRHHDKFYCSRSVLKNTLEYVKNEMLSLLRSDRDFLKRNKIDHSDIADIYFTTGTELEFWVRTTMDKVSKEELSLSQELKESYWKRTKGQVRKSLEETLIMLEKYGIEPEMGHKEVGGVKGKISREGRLYDVMEQLEIDWRFTDPLQAADNEIFVRYVVKEIFRNNGLEAIFVAKPVDGVAGSGEHIHIGMGILLKNGRRINIFAPQDKKLYLSGFGYGALMGLLKNWRSVNPFVTNSHSAIKRLQPGFEAPVSVVASLGLTPASPSRNRTVLTGLVRSDNPLSVRFEVRAPNPHTNVYIAVSAFYLAMIDGIRYSVKKSDTELDIEIRKKSGEKAGYLLKERQYVSERDIFEHYSQDERNKLFGITPKTVWEIIGALKEDMPVFDNTPFTPEIIYSYFLSSLRKWLIEIREKEFNYMRLEIVNMFRYPEKENGLDRQIWAEVQDLINEIAKDDVKKLSLMTLVLKEIEKEDFAKVSERFFSLKQKYSFLLARYKEYRKNII